MAQVNNQVTTATQTTIANLYISILGRNPEPAGFGFWCDRLADNGNTPAAAADIARGFANSPEFIATYGGQTTAQAMTLMYNNVLNRAPDAQGLAFWVAQANALISRGTPVSDAYALTGAAIITTAGTNNSSDTALIVAKQNAAIASGTSAPISTYTLTPGTDIINGSNSNDVFQGAAVATALIPAQTLNNTDNLNGGTGYNVLNAQLVDLYTVPAGLTNIQEINLTQVSLPTVAGPGEGNALDLINANDTQVLGFSGFASFAPIGLAILNVETELNTVNFANIYTTPPTEGEDAGFTVQIENTGTSLGGDDDTLTVNLSNVTGSVGLELLQTQAEDFGYETVNIAVTGSRRNASVLELEDVNGTISTINLSGNSTTFSVIGSGLSLDHLRTFDASAFTGNLGLEFTGLALVDEEIQDVSVIGAQGDNVLTFEGTVANATVTTSAGDDVIFVANAGGDYTLNVGEGNNVVETELTLGDIAVVAGGGDNEVDILAAGGDVTVTVTAGGGDNIVDIVTVGGNVTVTVGSGLNDVIIDDIDGDVTVTAGNGGNLIDVINVTPEFDEDDVLVAGAITVTTGAGDDELTLDTARFAGPELILRAPLPPLQGVGVTVDLGAGDNTLFLNGGFAGNVSFDDASITNVANLVVLTAVSVPFPVSTTVDISELAGSLKTFTFAETVNQSSAEGSITIDGAPTIGTLAFDKDASFAGLLQINDVENLTLDIAAGNIDNVITEFSFGKSGSFVAADLETLTINMGFSTSFQGVTYLANPATSDVNNLTTVTVTGGNAEFEVSEVTVAASTFDMDFDNIQTGSIDTIDLSAYLGDVSISTFSIVRDTNLGFGQGIEITLGSGNVDYQIFDINNGTDGKATEDDFVFTTDFASVTISGFEAGGTRTADTLDLSEFGIRSGADLIFTTANNTVDLEITARLGEFDGTITLVGYTAADASTIASLNIIYA